MADANHKARPFVLERFVTVQESWRYPKNWAKHLHYPKCPPPTPYPWIKLAGLWIEDAGFVPGQRVKIAVERERLIITTI